MTTDTTPAGDQAVSYKADQEILLAEDDPIFRALLRTSLSKWGYRTVLANDGNQAWEILQQENAPRLILLDWMMPGVDGPELCRRVRAADRTFYQYILLVTAKDNTEDVITGLELGADDYLKKPFAMGELRARLLVGTRILSLQQKLIQAREDLQFRATHDNLTGLWNRATVLDLLERNLHRGQRSQSPTGLLMIDLDHFKSINDTYGHLAGDSVLREVARRITQSVRDYDFVGRYGGEEFLVVVVECDEQKLFSAAERIRLAISASPILAGSTEVPVTASVGATVVPPPVNRTEDLLHRADTALYQAKNAGRNRTQIFEPLAVGPLLSEKQTAGTGLKLPAK
jgi:two-component system, cell cycle response regulator